MRIVATTSIVGDILANVVGDAATVEVLIPVGADPHDFRPSARHVAAIAGADLVVAVGLSLEEGLADALLAAVDDGANVLEIGPHVDPLVRDDSGGDDPDDSWDPHVWLDPTRVAAAVDVIVAELNRIAPESDWGGAAAYRTELEAADSAIAEILAAVPASSRLLVTSHDSMRYFADRYGFEIVGVITPGGSSLAAPSASDLAALVELMTTHRVGAVFAETTETANLAESVAEEAGDIPVVELYTGSLGEAGSGGATLIDMLLTNARRIAAALS